jgi:prepilin-type N-terminal cleavage/methylation domain-containing protein
MPTRRGRRAFTLVELLVVVGIIAVLVAIMLPIVTRVRGSAINQICRNNLRQIGMGILAYCDHHRGRYADPVTLGGAACRRLVGERDPDDPAGPPETYGWSALLDGLGYLSADRATGGVWVCPAARERVQAYKNTYCAWTMPRGPGRDKMHAAWQVVWENQGEVAFAPCVLAPMRITPIDEYVGSASVPSSYDESRNRGPHWYRKGRTGIPEPESRSGIPNGTVFVAGGYSHALLADLSLATFQHYKVVTGPNFEAWMSPERVD